MKQIFRDIINSCLIEVKEEQTIKQKQTQNLGDTNMTTHTKQQLIKVLEAYILDSYTLPEDLMDILVEHVSTSRALELAEELTGLNESDIQYEFNCQWEENLEGMPYKEAKALDQDSIAKNEEFSNWLDAHDSLLEIQKQNYCL